MRHGRQATSCVMFPQSDVFSMNVPDVTTTKVAHAHRSPRSRAIKTVSASLAPFSDPDRDLNERGFLVEGGVEGAGPHPILKKRSVGPESKKWCGRVVVLLHRDSSADSSPRIPDSTCSSAEQQCLIVTVQLHTEPNKKTLFISKRLRQFC